MTVCNFLEDELADAAGCARLDGDDIAVELHPFQILTLRLS